ncbi:MAG TPA: glycosyltransferase [Vitreimonas sp.]|nr:glycosyltransferase [Vitreimonas sp.]
MIADQTALGDAFIVAGMHRSGTSAVSRVLSLLGAELPLTLMQPGFDNPKGFWESAKVAALNDEILGSISSSWDDLLAHLIRRREVLIGGEYKHRIGEVLRSEYSLARSLVLKEPRVGLLLDLWMDALADQRFTPCVIIPVRDPLEVAASLGERNKFTVGRSLLLWLTYFLSAERASRGSKRVFVHYEDFLLDWRAAMRRIETKLGVRFPGWTPAAEREIDAYLSWRDRHHQLPPELIHQRSDVADWVKQAYAWAGAATREAEPDAQLLDEVADDFAASTSIFAPVITEHRATEASLREAVRALEGRAGALSNDIRDRDISIWALEGDVRDREERLAALNADLLAAETRIADLSAERQALENELASARAEAGASVERSAHFEAALRDQKSLTEQALALAAEEADLRNERIRILEEDLEARRTELAQAQAHLGRFANEKADLESLIARERVQAVDERARLVLEIERERTERARERDDERARARAAEVQWSRDREEAETKHAAHIASLEESVRSISEAARHEGEERRRFESLAEAQAEFLTKHRPLGVRFRNALWRSSWLRLASDAAEFARLSAKRGPVEAARLIAAARTVRRSGEFDVQHYLAASWDVRASGRDPVIHYLETGAAEGRDPSARFSTAGYLRRNPDVVRAGANPLFHYLRHGRSEGRSAPNHELTPPANPERSAPVPSDPYAVRPDDIVKEEAERGEAFLARYALTGASADYAGAVAHLNGLQRAVPNRPTVSVIVPVYGQLAYTLNCLDSLLQHRSKHAFEVIVVDDRSPDATKDWISRVGGVRLHARAQNGGFIEACNDGAEQARGEWLVFLNNDTRVVAGWLDALIASFASLKDAGLVGSKLFYPDGSLQEAGGIIWRDGSAWNYGRNDDPGKPEYCYARPVDYVSGASVAISRKTWNEIGGFDRRYKPAYGEDSDLALKVRYARGEQVWLQPLSRIIHYEGKTSGTDVTTGVKAYQVANAKTLFETWKPALSRHRENGEQPLLEKDRGVAKRALVIDATTPEPEKDAGSVTCLELMRALQSDGYKVSFVAEDNLLYLPQATGRLQALGIEALYWPYVESFDRFIADRGGEFDVVMIFRVGVAERRLDVIRRHCPKARVIFHSSDLHFLREERAARLKADSAALASVAATRERELGVMRTVDAAIVHSTFERDTMASLAPDAKVYVFPWILDPAGRTAPFAARRDIAFLGGYRHSPNVDAVRYFAEKIWPHVRARRPDMKFIVAGSECPEELLQLHGRDNIEVVGFVDDLAEFFGRIRLSVAPIRYGAGIKGKVAMSLAHGVPGVLTSCAAEGMELKNGAAVIIRDEERAFAEEVVKLYDDERRWLRMSDEALDFVERSYGSKLAARRIEELLALAGA